VAVGEKVSKLLKCYIYPAQNRIVLLMPGKVYYIKCNFSCFFFFRSRKKGKLSQNIWSHKTATVLDFQFHSETTYPVHPLKLRADICILYNGSLRDHMINPETAAISINNMRFF